MTLRELRARIIYHMGLATHIFIHIPKNAGVAVRKASALRNKLVSADPYFHKSRAYTGELGAFMQARGEHHGFQHARLRDLDHKKLAHLQPVAIIRNPWARVVSRFRFAQTAIKLGAAEKFYSASSFEEFLEERHVYGDMPYYWHRAIRGWYPQVDYVLNSAGELGADILRQEFMADEATCYFNLISPLARRNVSDVGEPEYQTYFTQKTIQIVADWYVRDIETFGFDFDTAAQKNTQYTAH